MNTQKFPHPRDGEALPGITPDHLPRDGSLGRVRRFAKGACVWRPDEIADRIYFLRKGWGVVTTAEPDKRPVALHTVELDRPFGEPCLCSVRTDARGTTHNNFQAYLHQNHAALDALMVT
jgi:CRP-like cAMP-binding protein